MVHHLGMSCDFKLGQETFPQPSSQYLVAVVVEKNGLCNRLRRYNIK
jgi:hypothetical protein